MISAAAQCAYSYERQCDVLGNYCDRRLVAFDGPRMRAATEAELLAFEIAVENLKAKRRHHLSA
jgi:hypothetical protein